MARLESAYNGKGFTQNERSKEAMTKTRDNYLHLFSKLPEPGLVKTRLSTLKDGLLTPEDAAELYTCMLLDVVDICMGAFDELEAQAPSRDKYTLVISCVPEANVARMEALITGACRLTHPVVFIADTGANFDEHYNDAFEQVWKMGADCILSMGADMPALTPFDITNGFNQLHDLLDNHTEGIVLAPDQEMGVSIIGWTRATPFGHTGVFYNQQGKVVLSAYIEKAAERGLCARYLPPVPDVDTMADLMHNITLIQALAYCHGQSGKPWARRTAEKLAELGMDEVRVPPNALYDPRDAIDTE